MSIRVISIVIVFLIHLTKEGLGQPNRLIKGMVSDRETNIPLNSIFIKHINRDTIFQSDRQGLFHLEARKGDRLVFLSPRHLTDTLTVNESTYYQVKLKTMSIVLPEVFITSRRNTSPQQKLEENRREYKDIYSKGDTKNMFTVGVGFALDITKLYNALGKSGRDARRLQRTLQKDFEADMVEQRFNRALVSNITKLEGKDLDLFMINYLPDYDWINSSSDYDIIVYIRAKWEEFKGRNK